MIEKLALILIAGLILAGLSVNISNEIDKITDPTYYEIPYGESYHDGFYYFKSDGGTMIISAEIYEAKVKE